MLIESFGFLAAACMVVMYALEKRSRVYVLGFAMSCAAASLYAFLIRSWAVRGSRSGMGADRAARLAAGPSNGTEPSMALARALA